MKKDRGFTLIELMITLAIAAILLSIAVPSFTRMIEDQRTVSQANDLLGSIQLARSEAVKRGRNVTMAPLSGTSFANGWIATVVDSAGNTVTITQHEPLTLMTSSPSVSLVFNSQGQASSGAASFELKPSSCAAGDKRKRSLNIAPTGRSSIAVVACP